MHFNKQAGVFVSVCLAAEKLKGVPGRFLVHNKNNSEPFVFLIMCVPTF